MYRLLTVAAALLLSGCALFQKQPEVGELSFVTAMTQLGEGLKALKTAEGDMTTGLIASDGSVTFNITASSKQDGNLKIDFARPVAEGVTTSTTIGGGVSSTATSQSGNTITLKFVNIVALPKDTLGGKGTLQEAGSFFGYATAPTPGRPGTPGRPHAEPFSSEQVRQLDGPGLKQLQDWINDAELSRKPPRKGQ
jgi:hypothetical protein